MVELIIYFCGVGKEYRYRQEIQHRAGGCHTTLLLFGLFIHHSQGALSSDIATRGMNLTSHLSKKTEVKTITATSSEVGLAVKLCRFHVTIAASGSGNSCLSLISVVGGP